MIEDEVKIEDLAKDQEIKDAAKNAISEAFPKEKSSIEIDDKFKHQLETAPMLVLVYASAVKAHAQNNDRTEPLKEFPDLIIIDGGKGQLSYAEKVVLQNNFD